MLQIIVLIVKITLLLCCHQTVMSVINIGHNQSGICYIIKRITAQCVSVSVNVWKHEGVISLLCHFWFRGSHLERCEELIFNNYVI